MKRLLTGLGVAVAAFAIGLGNFWLSQTFSWRSSDALPYCQVARNADWYHNRIIRVKARLIFASDGMYLFEDCDPVEALSSSVKLNDAQQKNGITYVGELLVTGDKSHLRTAEAIIDGHFNGYASTGCWRPKFHIDATKIELVSGVEEYSPAQNDTEELRTKH